MTRWKGIILTSGSEPDDELASRLPAHLHPIAGRPLVWHVAAAFAEVMPRPAELLLLTQSDLAADLFVDLPLQLQVAVGPPDQLAPRVREFLADAAEVVIADGASLPGPAALQSLVDAGGSGWVGEEHDAAAALIPAARLPEVIEEGLPLRVDGPALAGVERVAGAYSAHLIRNRGQLADAARRVRDRLVQSLMRGGVTFLLPESVLVDVDVRIGRDSIVYPGVVLEGQTTIGEETVVGPSCRIIDSWIGSGVELKGWNYISHTSVRNRAILEPYVRRGFD